MKKSTIILLVLTAAFVSAGWFCFDIAYLGISLLAISAVFAALALISAIRRR